MAVSWGTKPEIISGSTNNDILTVWLINWLANNIVWMDDRLIDCLIEKLIG